MGERCRRRNIDEGKVRKEKEKVSVRSKVGE